MKKAFRSVKLRLIFVILLMGIVPFTCMIPISLWAYNSVSIQRDASNMLSEAATFSNEVVSTGYAAGVQNPTMDMKFRATANAYNGRLMLINEALVVVHDTYGVDTGRTVVWDNVLKAAKGASSHHYDNETEVLTVVQPLNNFAGGTVAVLLMSKDMTYIKNNRDVFISYFLIAMVIIYSLSIFAAFTFSRYFTGPLNRIKMQLKSVNNEHSSQLRTTGAYKEVEEIAQAMNETLNKLQAIDKSRQEFVSNVSHELKTPLTSMKVLADSINESPDAPIEMYQEFMADITGEIDRENKIINDLLALVKMDKSEMKPNVEQVNINALIEAILKRIKPIADKAEVSVLFETFRPVTAEVDEVKLSLAISNLVENGIKYNKAGGEVRVTLNADHQYFYIKVEDDGLGIPEDALPYVFERFYRADKSHSRKIGGTGLGLAITKSAITLHKGEIKVTSVLGEGSTFDVRIPLTYIAEGEE